jgi:hypothetical protein
MGKNSLGNQINQANFLKILSHYIYFAKNIFYNLLVENKYKVLKYKSNGFER